MHVSACRGFLYVVAVESMMNTLLIVSYVLMDLLYGGHRRSVCCERPRTIFVVLSEIKLAQKNASKLAQLRRLLERRYNLLRQRFASCTVIVLVSRRNTHRCVVKLRGKIGSTAAVEQALRTCRSQHDAPNPTPFCPLRSVDNINAVVGNLRSLNLRGNLISTTGGLEKVFSLEDIDLSVNRIRDLQEAARLSTLPLLRRVWLKKNPLEAE